MSSGAFVRRYAALPGMEELLKIEGVVIVDSPPAGNVEGVDQGCVGMVGECVDMSAACSVNSSGEIFAKYQPQRIFSGTDQLQKLGGFDSRLGNTGDECGNVYLELANKTFSQLVVQPVNLITPGTGTSHGIRLWRELPTNRSATSTTPITPMSPATVVAGTDFSDGANRLCLAQTVSFTGNAPKTTAVNGTTTVAGLPAATVTITSATAGFQTNEVAVGDVVVVGSLAAAALSQNLICAAAGLCRVVTVDSNTQITIERMDGSNFTASTTWLAGAALAFRVHVGTDADTGGGYALASDASYTVLSRPLSATVAAATDLSPVVVPTAPSATNWDPLSGLAGITHPTGTVIYDANIHAANLAATSLLLARYEDAIDALAADDDPAERVRILVSARKYSGIHLKMRSHCLTQSSLGKSRSCIISPPLTTLTLDAVLDSDYPGVGGGSGGATRNERVIYAWPGARTYVRGVVGTTLDRSDGTTSNDGVIDTGFDTWVASLLSVLPPENDPGQALAPVPQAFSLIQGYQIGAPTLDMNSYIQMKQAGICGLRITRQMGPQIQSAVTTSLTSGEEEINRRRFADFIQDSLAARYGYFSKLLQTESRKDQIVGETEAFGAELKNEGNPAASRLADFAIDSISGNTPQMSARGVFVVRSTWRMLGSFKVIVAQTDVSPSAVVVRAG